MEIVPDHKPAGLSDQLALQRTLMAASRTLMAWTRTGLSQISFGFTIYKVLDEFDKQGRLTAPYKILTPDRVGMILLALGVFSITFGIIEYREIYRDYGVKLKRQPMWMAGLVALLGLALLVAIAFNL